jgi:N-acetyl-anhydromuramyl-L-alanine amidase AmpD
MGHVDMVVWHQTADRLSYSNLLKYFNSEVDGPKSYHYHIDRYGVVRRMCHWKYVAYHAGQSAWPVPPEGVRPGQSVNRRSIGVTFEGRLGDQLTDRQRVSGIWLYQQILEIPQLMVRHNVGHKEVAPTRRQDPSWDMDEWRKQLAQAEKEIKK